MADTARDSQLFSEYKEAHDIATRQMDRFYHEAQTDLEFYLNNQIPTDEYNYLSRQRRNALVFNKIKKISNLISGYQRNHRKAFRVASRHGGGAGTAEQLGKVLHQVMLDQGGFEQLSKVFEQGPVKTGFGLVNIYNDFSADPICGDPRISYVPWNHFFIDPHFTRIDLQDCAFMGRRALLSREEAKAIAPWARKQIEDMPKKSYQDSMFRFLAKSWDVLQQDLHALDEYWKLDHKEVTIIVDTSSGKWQEWPDGAGEERLQLLLQNNPNLRTKKHVKRSVKFIQFLDGHKLYEGLDPLGIDDYNFVPFLGFFDYEYHDWQYKLQGVIRPLRDPQRETNRRRSKMVDILDSQIHSGWAAEEGSVVDPSALYQTGQGKVVWTEQNKLDRVKQLQGGDIPQGLFHLAQQMDNDIMEIGGINSDMLGESPTGEERNSSTLSAHRRQQGMTTLQELFDNYYEAKGEVGRKLLRGIQENWTGFKVRNYLGEKPESAFFAPRLVENTITLEDAPLTTTQRQLEYMQKIELKAQGAPIGWSEVLKNAPLEGKDDLLKSVQQAEQKQAEAAEFQQQLEQAKLKEDIANTAETRSETALNKAKTVSEIHKTQADVAQTEHNIQSAEKDRMLRLLEIATQTDQAEREMASKSDSGRQ